MSARYDKRNVGQTETDVVADFRQDTERHVHLFHEMVRDRYVEMMFRQLPGAVWTTDRDLRLTYVAGRLAQAMRPRPKAGMSVFDILGTYDAANPVIAYHRAALSGESQSFEYEFGGRWYA